MTWGIKKTVLAFALTAVSSTAMAYIPEGSWTDGHSYYYVNNKYHYCTATYKPDAQWLSQSQVNELRYYTHDGICEGYNKGPKNYQGRSYYFNGNGAYCQYTSYNPQAPQLTSQQARDLFNANHFDGWCQQ